MKSVRTILLALAGLLVVAGSASAAFNPDMSVTIPTQKQDGTPISDTMGLSWVDMGSHSAGFRTWDLVVRIDAQPGFPNNDWAAGHLEVTTTAGSISQVANAWGLPHWSPQQMFWSMAPALEWDTFAIGAPKDMSQNYIIPWPAGSYGAPEVISGAVCDTTTINMDWFDYAVEGPGTYHIFRLTVSDDWAGTYQGFIQDNVTSGVGVDFEMVPEPVTMGLLAIGGLGMLLRRRRS